MATDLKERSEPTLRRFNVAEYYQMGELGWFRGQRVELIEGEVLRMSPQGALHGMCVVLIHEALQKAFGAGFVIRVQLPLRLADDTEPEPDLSVVPGSPRDYPEHPTTALLVVEVSDSSAAFDRGQKASLYAKAGVPEYWMLDIARRQLVTFRDPAADDSQPFGFAYSTTTTLSAADKVGLLARPGVSIPVASLLP